MLAIFLLSKFAFKEINIINGYSLQIHMIFFCLAIYCFRTVYFKIGWLIIVPFTALIFGFSGSLFFDYILPYWGFAIFVFLTFFSKKIEKKKYFIIWLIIITISFNVISYFVMGVSFTLSGVVFWKVALKASMIINLPIVGISLLISGVVTSLVIYPLSLAKAKISEKIYY